jgi:putative oxidoreductase
MMNAAMLILRVTVGGLLAGHGAQKLFGWFGGPGPEGTARWLESVGLKPGERWAPIAGLSELGGGLLTALGLLHPLGPVAVLAVMSMAALTAHRGKPIWVTSGGAELPLTNIAAALMIAFAGPGRYSIDAMTGLRLPGSVVAATVLAAAGGVVAGTAGLPALGEGREAA